MRQVPIKTQIEVFIRGRKNLVALILLVGGIVLSMALVSSDAYKSILFIGGAEEMRGKVTAVLETGERRGGQPLKRVLYNYAIDEKTYSGEGYASATQFEVGQRIKLEHPKLSKSHSRSQDMDARTWSLIFLLVPLTGLIGTLSNLKENLKVLHLIKSGIVTKGVLVQKERTGKREEGEDVYTLTFQFKDQEGKVQHIKDFTTEPSNYRNGIPEKIVYSPKEPTKAMTVDNLPVDVYLYDV